MIAASAWAQAAALRTVASNWRVSGILNVRSGSWPTVTSGRDNAFNGMASSGWIRSRPTSTGPGP